jgi:hypothetical protein
MNGAKLPTQVKTFELPIWIPATSIYSYNMRVSETLLSTTATQAWPAGTPFMSASVRLRYPHRSKKNGSFGVMNTHPGFHANTV